MSPFSITEQIKMIIHLIKKRTKKLAMNTRKTVFKFPKDLIANRRKRKEELICHRIKKEKQLKKWVNTTIIIIKIIPFIVISR